MTAPPDIRFREVETGDWSAIARLLGRPGEEGARLRRWIEQEYDPWFAWVAATAAAPPPGGADGASGEGGEAGVVGAIVAGAPRTTGGASRGDLTTGRVAWLGVSWPHRRRGIGTRLLELALDEMRRRRFGRVALSVDGTEVEAIALFRKAGFQTDGESLELVLSDRAAAALGAAPPHRAAATLRPLTLDDLPLLTGLLIQLGVERAEAPHDDLAALTPAQVEDWLQRPASVAAAAWDAADPGTPVGLAWASRRRDDAVLRFVGVHDDYRRRGLGRALLAHLAAATARPLGPASAAAESGRFRPLRAHLNEAGPEQAFFRSAGFEVERISYGMSRELVSQGV
jgi:ribosomal protein S18 acetylase RimI-like enzyme